MFVKSVLGLVVVAFFCLTTETLSGELTVRSQIRSAAPDTTGLSNASFVLCSSDGKFVYVAGFSQSRITQFARSGNDTTLTFVASTDSIRFIYGMALSPDEKFLYVSTYYSNTIECYSRNETSGLLSFSFRITLNPNTNWFLYPTRLRIDKAGQFLYVVSDNSLSVFKRNLSDGTLEFKQMLTDEKGNITELGGISGVDISPDGKFAYVASLGDSSVSWYQQDPALGTLTYAGVLHANGNNYYALKRPDHILVSPNGNYVVVGAGGEGACAWFSRNPATGALVFINELVDRGSSTSGLYELNDFRFFAHGTRIITAASNASGLISMDTATGTLLWLESAVIPVQPNFMHMGEGVAVSPDDKRIFIAGAEGTLTQLDWTPAPNAIRYQRAVVAHAPGSKSRPFFSYNLLGRSCSPGQTRAPGMYLNFQQSGNHVVSVRNAK
jgi:6-phosphogluconolactonase (cycloisomerase 2 family)